MLLGSLQHMRIDQHRQHAQRLVVLDETHPTHVGGKVVDIVGMGECLRAGALHAQIRNRVLRVLMNLVPLIERLEVYRPDSVALAQQVGDEMAPDEASTAGDYNQIIAHQTSVSKDAR